jgi:hypothetical protein
MVDEEAPRVLAVLVREQNPYAVLLGQRALAVVVPPDNAQEKGSSGAHDCDIRQDPAAVIPRQGVNDLQEKRMLRNASHGIV